MGRSRAGFELLEKPRRGRRIRDGQLFCDIGNHFAARGGLESLRFADNKLTAGHVAHTGSKACTVIPFVPGDTFRVLPRTAERGCGGGSTLVDLGTVRVPSS